MDSEQRGLLAEIENAELSQEATAAPADALAELALPTVSRRSALLDLVLILLTFGVTWFGGGWIGGITWTAFGVSGLAKIAGDAARLVVAAGVIAYLLWHNHLSCRSFGLRWDDLESQLLWTAATIGADFILAALTLVLYQVLVRALQPGLPNLAAWLQTSHSRPGPAHADARLFLYFLPALWEELFHRGLFIPYLRRLTGRWWVACTVSAFVFGAIHLAYGPLAAFMALLAGLIYGFVFIRTRSVLPAFGAHLMWNVITRAHMGWLLGLLRPV